MSEKLSVSEAVAQRLSVRAFLINPSVKHWVSDLLDKARGAPSGGNLQPWQVHVLMGEKLAASQTGNARYHANPSHKLYA